METQEKKENQGFSLVELIIVIAIMAILVGVIGSQAIPYLEKARESKDLATLDTVFYAFQSAVIENEVTSLVKTDGIGTDTPPTGLVKENPKLADSFKKLMGAKLSTDAGLNQAFKSVKGKGNHDENVQFIVDKDLITVKKGTLSIASDGAVVN
ncbi:MAG: prepilin-type N-terminal cleavage/methylation domain-containing protein [Acetivibrio sp.]